MNDNVFDQLMKQVLVMENTACPTATVANTDDDGGYGSKKKRKSMFDTTTKKSDDCFLVKTKKKKKMESCHNEYILEQKPVHYKDTDEATKFALDVAGYAVDDINVQLHDGNEHWNKNDKNHRHNMVAVTAERKNKLGDVYKIDRRFRLDPKIADVDKIDANIDDKNRILEVIVPKKKKTVEKPNGPRVIKISTAVPTLDGNDDKNERDELHKLKQNVEKEPTKPETEGDGNKDKKVLPETNKN